MVKVHHLWLQSPHRLRLDIDFFFQQSSRTLKSRAAAGLSQQMSFTLGQFPGPEVKVLSKILPFPQHSVFDCIHILSWNPIHPVVRGFCGAQLKCLEGKKENQVVLQRSGDWAGSKTHPRRAEKWSQLIRREGWRKLCTWGTFCQKKKRGGGGEEKEEGESYAQSTPRQWFPNPRVHQNHLEGLLEQIGGPTP